jgi:hypothetical protein
MGSSAQTLRLIGALAAGVASAHAAVEVSLTNAGFETGDLTGWTLVGEPFGSMPGPEAHVAVVGTDPHGLLSAAEGSHFVRIDSLGLGPMGLGPVWGIEQTVFMNAGDVVRGNAAWETDEATQEPPFISSQAMDGASVLIRGPVSARVWDVLWDSPLDPRDMPWTPWSFVAPVAGNYTVGYYASGADSLIASYGLFDAPTVDGVPDAASTGALVGLTAMALFGWGCGSWASSSAIRTAVSSTSSIGSRQIRTIRLGSRPPE